MPRALSPPSRYVNLALLVLLLLELLSGVVSLVVGVPDGRWVFWLHRGGGLAIVLLLGWKWRIVVRGYRRQGVTPLTLASALFALLVLGTLTSGVLWTTTGFPGLRVPLLGTLTGLGVHILLALLLVPLFLLHAVTHWARVRARRADFAGRRAALRWTALALAGVASWQLLERAAGAERRFTGSRERGSFSGNRFPSTNWLTDPRPRIDPADYQLHVGDATFTLDDLTTRLPRATVRATLDCTSGWYTTQDWRGVPLAALLAAARSEGGESVVVRSHTGYLRRFPLAEAGELLLATHVGDEPLTRGHGFPTRLVAPGYRGFEWVKWVVAVEVDDAPPWLQPPLPAQ